MNRLQRYLVTGLIVITPIFLTVYVLVFIFRFADGILGKFINTEVQERLGFYIPGIGFLLSILIIILVGFLANIFVGKRIFPRIEKWFSSLPLVKNIYPAFKQLVLFILAQKEFGFKKVVLIEYPSKGIWSVGFLTNQRHPKVSQEFNREMVPVFIPSTPGPLTGFVVFVAKEELRFIDMSIAEAIKIIISGGVLNSTD